MNVDPSATYLRLVPVWNTTEPNFRSAGWRVVQAGNRLREIQDRMPEVSKEWRGYPVVRAPKHDPSQLELSLGDWNWHGTDAARALTLLSSEVLHHARIALDYCAYHVVWLDSGNPSDGTKFPLVRNRNRWGKERRNAIPGVSDEHLSWIHEVQPFEGVAWSRKLMELSNRDKHRMAVEVVPVYGCRVPHEKIYADPLDDKNYIGFEVADAKLLLTIAPAMKVGSPTGPGLPLEETLAEILVGVTELVNKFLAEAGYSETFLSFGK